MREKLIELLEGSLRYAGDVCGETGDCSKCQYDKYGANCGYAIRADYFIANGVTIATDNNVGDKKQRFLLRENGDIIPLTNCPQWIPVTERLPEKEMEVIVYTGNILKPSVHCYHFWTADLLSWQSVTHWMPLPEPPKGE